MDHISKTFKNMNGQNSKGWFGGLFTLVLLLLLSFLFLRLSTYCKTLAKFLSLFRLWTQCYYLNSCPKKARRELPWLCTLWMSDRDRGERNFCFQTSSITSPFSGHTNYQKWSYPMWSLQDLSGHLLNLLTIYFYFFR